MPLRDDTQLRLIQSIQDVRDMVKWFEGLETNVLGLDTETSGLKIYQPDFKLRMIQIGDDHNGWAVPFHNWGGSVLELMREWDAKNGQWTLHNIAYDWKVLKTEADYEIPWKTSNDTMIMSRILFPDQPAGLKILTDKFVDPRASTGEDALKHAFKNGGWDWSNIPLDQKDYAFYSALDPVLAVNLYNALMPQISEIGLDSVYDLEMGVLRVMTRTEHRGVRVDLDYVEKTIDELDDTITKRLEYAQEHYGVNIYANSQVAQKLVEFGAEFTVRTPGGQPAVNKEQMDIFLEEGTEEVKEFVQFISETKHDSKMKGTYFEAFRELASESRIHPNINTVQAKSHRMSASNPNLQNLPSNEALVRNAFVADDEESIIVSSDYDQIEMRLLSILSKDTNLISVFNTADETGGDFFAEMGKMIYKDPDFQKSDPRRKTIKTLMYATTYGSGVRKLSRTSGIPEEELSKTMDQIYNQFPGFKRFMDENVQEAETRLRNEGYAYILLESGRRMPVEQDKLYKANNQAIQSRAAEVLKKAIVRLEAYGLDKYMLLPVHDEILFSMHKDEFDTLAPIIGEAMSFTDEYPVKLTAAAEIKGYRWGDAY